jgi:hypothetical protein
MRALVLAAILAALPLSASADTRSGLANTFAVVQSADCVTTVALVKAPNTFERDPLAKPVAHSLPLCLAAAGGINLFLRNPHHPLWMLRLGILLESLAVVNNERVLLNIRVGK